ncbi:MAG: Ig-like domain-containing protein [Lachnospiraceae bacterium]|nr:Ig-like domain-containing protein [Lachnospiraceae bacterium]
MTAKGVGKATLTQTVLTYYQEWDEDEKKWTPEEDPDEEVNTVTVYVEDPSIEKSISMNVGESRELAIAGLSSDSTDYYPVWSTSAVNVASVSDNGTVTANGAGTAKVTVSILGKTLTCNVKVVDFTKVTDFSGEIDLSPSQTETIKKQGFTANGATWKDLNKVESKNRLLLIIMTLL